MLIGLGDQFFSNAADRVGLGHQGKLMKIYAPIATLVFALIAPINLHANVISILPPPTLTLDSLVISEGVFSITSGTQYLTNGTSSSITLLQNTHNATIGGTEPSAPLFEFNNTAQALQFVGNFDASSPDLPAANFQITLGVSPGLSSMALQSLFTFFLEPDTTNTLHQVTDLGATTALGDNTNTFFGTAVGAGFLVDPGGNRIQLGNWFFSNDGSEVFTPSAHGTGTLPEPSMLGLFGIGLLGLAAVARRRKTH